MASLTKLRTSLSALGERSAQRAPRSDSASASPSAPDQPTNGTRIPQRPTVGTRAATGHPRARRTIHTQWLALGAALVVLAGVVVAWAVGAAGRRVMVVQLARPVAAGAAFEIDDLMLTGVAVEPGVDALVPAASLDALVGRIAVVDLDAGVLLQRGLWRNGSALRDGERAVGAVLDAGRFPRGLTVGDIVVGDSIADPATSSLDAFVDVGRTDATSATVVDAPALPAVMRVIDLVALDDGRLSISLAVPIASAIEIARLAATDQLVVVGTLLAEQLATVTPTIGPSP